MRTEICLTRQARSSLRVFYCQPTCLPSYSKTPNMFHNNSAHATLPFSRLASLVKPMSLFPFSCLSLAFSQGSLFLSSLLPFPFSFLFREKMKRATQGQQKLRKLLSLGRLAGILRNCKYICGGIRLLNGFVRMNKRYTMYVDLNC